MLPKVSVIIPVYNSEKYLEKCILSLQKQTYPSVEIIIVDDSSTDNSLEIAKKHSAENLKVLTQENSGAGMARNKGLSVASGEFIQFMDADDYLSPDKIQKQVEALVNNEYKVAVCDYINFCEDEELDKVKPADQNSFIYSSDDPAAFLINLWGGNGKYNFIQTNCWLVPRLVINKAGGWRNYRCPDDDGEFFARVLMASSGIVYVPKVYNFYRRSMHTNKLSQKKDRKYIQNVLLTIDLKYNYLKKYSGQISFKKAFATQYQNFAVYNYPACMAYSKIALRRLKAVGINVPLPVLGGKAIEGFKKIFGWKAARRIKYLLQEKR